jgi:pantoate--beta-alanine ligase
LFFLQKKKAIEMKILKTIAETKRELTFLKKEGKSIGFVPTMGALHAGHISLIRKCREENDITVVSIYVNPTQFNDSTDYKNYPVTLDADIGILEDIRIEYLFLPDYHEMYPDGFTYSVEETDLSKILCGASRPGHFKGVLTVVLKLLNIVNPNRAYFGEKDYQQYLLIKGMAEAFFLDSQIIPVPVVREESGLAMSSRNLLLDENSRKTAPLFYQILTSARSSEEAVEILQNSGFRVDYVQDIGKRRYGAVILGNVRLIDNVQL